MTKTKKFYLVVANGNSNLGFVIKVMKNGQATTIKF